jgi:hypothetical protein
MPWAGPRAGPRTMEGGLLSPLPLPRSSSKTCSKKQSTNPRVEGKGVICWQNQDLASTCGTFEEVPKKLGNVWILLWLPTPVANLCKHKYKSLHVKRSNWACVFIGRPQIWRRAVGAPQPWKNKNYTQEAATVAISISDSCATLLDNSCWPYHLFEMRCQSSCMWVGAWRDWLVSPNGTCVQKKWNICNNQIRKEPCCMPQKSCTDRPKARAQP